MQCRPVTITLLLMLCTFGNALAATSCNEVECNRGAVLTTYATASDAYFACPTRRLSEYTQFVLGLVSLQAQVTGKMPTLSRDTGEPQYQGETKTMVDAYRKAAGVGSFNEAVTKCAKGPNGAHVRVEENPKDSFAILVSDHSGMHFWLPKIHVDKD
jgi:hypothetical protein